MRIILIIVTIFFYNQILYAKNYDGLLKALNKAKKSEISINLDTISKEYGYKNFKSFLKDFKRNNNIKRLSVEDAKIFFQGYDKNLKIVESDKNLDKFHQLVIENKTLRRYTSYFKKKNSEKLKWLAAAVDYKKEMSKITENYNLKKISPFPWGWSYINATDALLNCKREKQSLGIIFGPECILVDISQNNVHLNVITPKDKIEICIENSKVLYPKKYDTTVKDFRDKRYKAYCSSDLFFLPGKGKKLNRLKTKIESNKFLYAKLEEDNPLLVKIKKEEQEEKRLEKEKLEAKKKKLEAQRKAEKEKLEAKKKEEEEKLKAKKKAEKERLEAKKKEEEEKEKLAEEKRIKQKRLEEKKLSLIPKKTKKEIAKITLINIQSYIKSNPDEFDILEISEFFIKTRPILEDKFNEQLENDLNSLILYVQKSENYKSYLEEIEIEERKKNLEYIDKKILLINNQIEKVTNFLRKMPNSIHAKKWLDSVKIAKQQLNNFNSLDDLLVSSNDLSILISNQENLVKLNTESKKLIIELKDYLAENLTTDLAPKILEQIDSINKSIETEDQSQIKIANQNAQILLNPKRKAEKEKLEAKRKAEKEKLEAKRKAEEEKSKLFNSVFNTKWGMKGIPCDHNGGTYYQWTGRGFMFWAGGKPQDSGGLSLIEADEVIKLSSNRFIVTQRYFPTRKNKIMFDAVGSKMSGKITETYTIENEDLLSVKREIKALDIDAILNGYKGDQVGYTYKTEYVERVRCK